MLIRVCARNCCAAAAIGLALGAARPAAAIAAVAAVAKSAAVTGASRVGEADVRESAGGVPCFTIAEREERRSGAPSFEAIDVSDVSRKPPVPMWQMAMPAGRTFPLMFSMCIPYAGRVPSLPQESAEALEPGRLYQVSIAVRAGNAAQPRAYRARFCLLRQADGRNGVRMVGVAASAPACAAAPAPQPHGGKRKKAAP